MRYRESEVVCTENGSRRLFSLFSQHLRQFVKEIAIPFANRGESMPYFGDELRRIHFEAVRAIQNRYAIERNCSRG